MTNSKPKPGHRFYRGVHYKQVEHIDEELEELDLVFEPCDTCSNPSIVSSISLTDEEDFAEDENEIDDSTSHGNEQCVNSDKNIPDTPMSTQTEDEMDFFERLKSGEVIDLEVWRAEQDGKKMSLPINVLREEYAEVVKKNLVKSTSENEKKEAAAVAKVSKSFTADPAAMADGGDAGDVEDEDDTIMRVDAVDIKTTPHFDTNVIGSKNVHQESSSFLVTDTLPPSQLLLPNLGDEPVIIGEMSSKSQSKTKGICSTAEKLLKRKREQQEELELQLQQQEDLQRLQKFSNEFQQDIRFFQPNSVSCQFLFSSYLTFASYLLTKGIIHTLMKRFQFKIILGFKPCWST